MKFKFKFIVTVLLLTGLIFILVGCGSDDSNNTTTTYSLNVTSIGEGEVIISPNKAEYAKNEVVTLTVEPEDEWDFAYWRGSGFDGNRNTQIQLTMSSDITIEAIFANVITLKDDFSSNVNEWNIDNEDGFIRDITDNKYSMTLTKGYMWASPNKLIANNFEAEVDFEFITPDVNYFTGFLFNYEDKDNHYMLRIEKSGNYCIERKNNGEIIKVNDWEETTINSSINNLSVNKIGKTYSFSLNGNILADITINNNLPYIALLAGAYDKEVPVTVLFDYFEGEYLSFNNITATSTGSIININKQNSTNSLFSFEKAK